MIPAVDACSRHLRHLLTPLIRTAATTPGADRYRKHFPAVAHLWLLLLYGLGSAPSLRQGYAELRAMPGLFARLGLGQGLSFSQLARSSTSRPGACFERLLQELLAHVHHTRAPDRQTRILRKVVLLDSTVLSLSASLSPWSQYKGAAPGVRVQTTVDLGRLIPTSVSVTLADINDHEALKARDLTAWRGWTLLIDLGYYGHKQLTRLRDAEVSFVTRLHPQAAYVVTARREVGVKPTRDGDVVLSDETIVLGSSNNRQGAVLSGIRLVRSRNPRGVEQAFLSDRFDLTAADIVRLYHKRWQIELIFRFLKQHLAMTTPVGTSREAVWLTIVLAIIIALLLALTADARDPAMSAIAWLRALGVTLLTHLRGG